MTDPHSLLIPTRHDIPYYLGRHKNHDPRNRLPQFRALAIPPKKRKVPYRVWNTVTTFDQLETPSCTAQAATSLLFTEPFVQTTSTQERTYFDTNEERVQCYLRWQVYDPPYWPVPHDGSATDSPFKGLRQEGRISSYRWLFGEQELRNWLTWYGPAVVGTNWYMDMFYPVTRGGRPISSSAAEPPSPYTEYYIVPGGELAGGHAYRIVQYSRTRDAYRIVNSWGTSWADNGRAWIRSADLARLLSEDGEAVTIG